LGYFETTHKRDGVPLEECTGEYGFSEVYAEIWGLVGGGGICRVVGSV
jgi:hypothetical protein